MRLKLRKTSDVLLLPVQIQPRAAHNQIVGEQDGALKIRLTSPPLENRANRLLVQFLAGCLGISRADIELLRGQKSRRKTLAIRGLCEEELLQRLIPHIV